MALPAADGPVQTHPPAAARVQNISPRQDAGGGQGGVFDPSDLSWIVKLAAIGDSYSAGIGAGERLGTAFNAMDYQSGELMFFFALFCPAYYIGRRKGRYLTES